MTPSRTSAEVAVRGIGTDRRQLSLAEIAELPATVDLVTAGRAVGIGRTTAHKLARAGQFPCPVLRIGGVYRVPTAGLLALLGIELKLQIGPTTPQSAVAAGGAP